MIKIIMKCFLYYGLLSQLFVTQCDINVATKEDFKRCEKYIAFWGFMYSVPIMCYANPILKKTIKLLVT